ncbi:hypothetical protein CAEBREN_09323 [Caenorhabditis brenneri]|uniref:Origin recognition complex subunit 1 n=1 Tax=Caenorhabditis brenneri TaxID=135651 RepID=G0MKX5_CAEBE|nr:hypothetical protein CAEBREN_09323 [Caenorhabditis brenneri]
MAKTEALPEKRRSERIITKLKVPSPKPPTRKSAPPRATRNKGAPQYSEQSPSSSSSDEDDEDSYNASKDVEDNNMDVEEYSDEIGEDFSDAHSEISTRSRSNSDASNKENPRRCTRSQMSSRNTELETPSKVLARQLRATTLNTPSKKKNLAKEKSSSKTPVKGNKPTPGKRRTTAGRTNVSVFPDSDNSEEEGEAQQVSRATRNNARTPNVIRIPTKLIPKKITPIRITKTPGGSFRTRQHNRKNSEEGELVDPLDSTSATSLRELASRLHLSKVPEKLPCREDEAKEVQKFIREVIDPKRGESSAMYISGVPGTGKTATVRAVVSSMKKDKKCPDFVYVEVNAMIFKKTVFVEIYNGIQEKHPISKKTHRTKVASSTARQELNAMFKKEDKHRPPIVVLIDELDSLCNRKQDILYDIFEWTALPQSKVTIIGIANTLDFPERMLCQRNASRLDKRRLVFQPYQHDQIEEIVRARLQGSSLIEPKAIELVAKKISTNTGDLRQALDFLCRAIGVAVERKSEKLEVSHVLVAQSAVLEPLKYRLVKDLTLHEFTLFRTIVALTKEQEEIIFAEIYKTYCSFCSETSGIRPASDTAAYGMLLELSNIALIHVGKVNQGRVNLRVKLGMASMEADKAVNAFIEAHKSDYSV